MFRLAAGKTKIKSVLFQICGTFYIEHTFHIKKKITQGKGTLIKQNTWIYIDFAKNPQKERRPHIHVQTLQSLTPAATEPQALAEGMKGTFWRQSPSAPTMARAGGDPLRPGNAHHLPPAWKSKADGITVGTCMIRNGAAQKEPGAAPAFIPLSPHYTAHPVFSYPSGPSLATLIPPFGIYTFPQSSATAVSWVLIFFIYKISPLLTLFVVAATKEG